MLLDEQKLSEDFQELVRNANSLNFAADYVFSELIDDIILNIIFENHYELKIQKQVKSQEENDSIQKDGELAEKSKVELEQKTQNGDTNNNDDNKVDDEDSNSSNSSKKGKVKFVYCKCSNCQKVVAVQKFATHLEQCMGIRKSRLRKRKEPSQ